MRRWTKKPAVGRGPHLLLIPDLLWFVLDQLEYYGEVPMLVKWPLGLASVHGHEHHKGLLAKCSYHRHWCESYRKKGVDMYVQVGHCHPETLVPRCFCVKLTSCRLFTRMSLLMPFLSKWTLALKKNMQCVHMLKLMPQVDSQSIPMAAFHTWGSRWYIKSIQIVNAIKCVIICDR